MTSPSRSAAAGQAAGDGTAGQAADGGAAVAGQVASDASSAAGQGASGGTAGQTAAGDAAAGHPAGPAPERSFDAGPLWARLTPPVAALALSLWGIATPSFWRDEAATIAAVRRPFGDLITMLGHVDAVHAAYYMMMWPLVRLFGSGEFVVRLPSAIAIGVAAAAVAAIGRRLISPWAGLAAGLVFAVLPGVTRYGQEARSYAMVIAVASIASYLLVRMLGAAPERRLRWLVGYGVGLAALGIANIFALLIIPAHAVTVLLDYRRHAADSGSRRLVAGWLAAAAASVVIASPLLVLGWRERGQIGWLAVNKSSSGPGTLLTLDGSLLMTVVMLAVIGIGLAVSLAAGQDRRRAASPWPLAELSVPWLILPAVILLTGSLITPMYTSRYVLMCLPALALLGGAALAALGRIAGPAALVVLLLAGLTTQLTQREPAGHYDNIRAVDRIVAANARPGDVVLYTNPNAEAFGAAYPYGLGTLRNIALKQAAIPSGTLAGTTVPLAEIRQRLEQVGRVWVVEINKRVLVPRMENLSGLPVSGPPVLLGLPFHQIGLWHERGDYLLLFARD